MIQITGKLALVATVLTLAVSAGTPGVGRADGLIANWTLNQPTGTTSIPDNSGNGHTATLLGSDTLTSMSDKGYPNSPVGGGLYFSGLGGTHLLGCCAAAFLFRVHSRWHCKDADLIAIFHAHRQAFDKLQQMAAEDVRHGWHLGITEKDKISKSRLQQYKYEQLISEIYSGLDVAMDGYGDGMRFIFKGGGISAISPGWVKGIQYVPGAYETNGAIYGKREVNGVAYPEWQGLISSNLDEASTLPPNVYLRPIEPKWFIFFQRTD